MPDVPPTPSAPGPPGASANIDTLVLVRPQPENLSIAMNVRQKIFSAPTDRANLVLRDFKDALAAKFGMGTAAGTLGAVITTLLTAEFKNILGMTNEVWWSLYLFAGIVCLVAFGWASYLTYQRRRMRDIDAVLERLKRNT